MNTLCTRKWQKLRRIHHSVPPNDVPKSRLFTKSKKKVSKSYKLQKKKKHGPAVFLHMQPPGYAVHKLLPGASQPLSINRGPDATKVAMSRPSSTSCQLPPGLTRHQSTQGFDPCKTPILPLLPAGSATTPRQRKTLGHARDPRVRRPCASFASTSSARQNLLSCILLLYMPCEGTGKCENKKQRQKKEDEIYFFGSRRSGVPYGSHIPHAIMTS